MSDKMYLLLAIICSIIPAAAACIYLNNDKIGKASGVEKLRAMFALNTGETIAVIASVLLGVAAYVVQHYVYGASHSNFMCLRWATVTALLVPIAWIDFKKWIIPNKLLFCGLCMAAILVLLDVLTSGDDKRTVLLSAIGGAAFGAGILLICSFLVKGGMGAGDIKMYAVIGLFCGLTGTFNAMLYTMIVCLIVGVILMIIRKKKIKDQMQMAPFALLGVLIAVAIGG